MGNEFSRIYLSEQAKFFTNISDYEQGTLDEILRVVYPQDKEYVREQLYNSAADSVIVARADALTEAFSQGYCYRYGGDELRALFKTTDKLLYEHKKEKNKIRDN